MADGADEIGALNPASLNNMLNMDFSFMSVLLYDGPMKELSEKVSQQDHVGICHFLRSSSSPKEAVNYDLSIGPAHTSFTGLEYAIFKGDWKMAAIFFVHGADPENNVFDGVLETMASYHGFGGPDIFPGFDGDDPKPIKGFGGLTALVDDDDDGDGKAHLWILECLYNGSVSVPDDYGNLSRCLDAVSSDLQYTRAQLEAFVLTTLCSMKRLGLPNEVALRITESAVLDTLWEILEKFACRDLNDVEQDGVDK